MYHLFCPLVFGVGNVRVLTDDKISVVGLQQNEWKKKEFDDLGLNTCTLEGQVSHR